MNCAASEKVVNRLHEQAGPVHMGPGQNHTKPSHEQFSQLLMAMYKKEERKEKKETNTTVCIVIRPMA